MAPLNETLTLYPAIDLQGGACVRLRQGDLDQPTVYNEDPAAQAKAWADAGFEWVHVVDLDGAVAGSARNKPAVEAILSAVSVPVQLGGGIRDRAAIDAWLETGLERVILGTVAVRDPALVKEAAKAHPGRVVVGIDARDGKAAVSGWVEASELAAEDLAKRFEDAGVAALVYTDISRDGMLSGVNVAATAALARAVSIPVIASGGVSGAEDIRRLRAERAGGAGIEGVILGRALYDGRLKPDEARAAARSAAVR